MKKYIVMSKICNVITGCWIVGIFLLALIGMRNEELGISLIELYENMVGHPYGGTLTMFYDKLSMIAFVVTLIALIVSAILYGLRHRWLKLYALKTALNTTKHSKSLAKQAPAVVETVAKKQEQKPVKEEKVKEKKQEQPKEPTPAPKAESNQPKSNGASNVQALNNLLRNLR